MKTFLKSAKGSQVKVLVLAACLSAIPQLAMASTNESVSSPSRTEQLKIVPTLGYSYFNIQGSSTDYKSKAGNSLAVLAQMPIMGGQVELESGLEYLETGAKQTVDSGFFGLSIDTNTITIKQLAVPLRAKYVINPTAEGTHWYGKAGLTPTFVMSAKSEDALGGSTDIKSDLNSIGLLTQAGFGADWGIAAAGRVSLDFTYSYGLTKVSKNEDGRATGFQIQAGYAFNL